MPGRTVLLLTGRGVGVIETAARLARLLTPATIILEDVDLIGTARAANRRRNACSVAQRNGWAGGGRGRPVHPDDEPSDVLEPAARPGRIDQAIEVPLPDDAPAAAAEAYGRGLTMELNDHDGLVTRTRASRCVIRELRARPRCSPPRTGGELVVRDRHVEEALTELLVAGAR
jgi:hypothetical protein